MVNYYLTEMNTVKLENCILQFIYKEHLTPLLVNGVTSKVIAMMYNKGIDYYYSDTIATNLDVPIKFVDNIYLKDQGKYYNKKLSLLLENTDYTGTPETANQFEEEIKKILETRKKIHTTKNIHKGAKQWK